MIARDLRYLAVDAVRLGGAAAAQALGLLGHAILDHLSPLDDSRAEAHRQALVDAEADIEVFEPTTESDWLGHGRPAASAGSGIRPGAVCDVPPSPAPGHSTSDLLIAAADQLERRGAGQGFARGDHLRDLIADLRERAELFANQDD